MSRNLGLRSPASAVAVDGHGRRTVAVLKTARNSTRVDRRVVCRVAQELDVGRHGGKLASPFRDDPAVATGPVLREPLTEEADAEPRTITDIWSRNASQYGDMLAVHDPHHEGNVQLTFSEVYEGMQDVAAGLQGLGVARHDKVALFAENSARWLLADGGVMAAGAADVVRGASAPPEELLFIAQHSGAVGALLQDGAALDRVLAAAQQHSARVPDDRPLASLRFVVLLWGEPSAAQRAALAAAGCGTALGWEALAAAGRAARGGRPVGVALEPQDLATLVYTSGTTGHPKGVMLTHANLAYQVRSLPAFLTVRPGERVLSLLPPWHIYERTCSYYVLSSGGHQVYTNLRRFREDLTAFPPDHFVCVPLVLDTLHTRVRQRLAEGSKARAAVAGALLAASCAYVRARRVVQGASLAAAAQALGQGQAGEGGGLGGAAAAAVRWLAVAVAAALLAPLNALAGRLVFGKIREALGIRRTVVSGGGSLAAHLDDFYEAIGLPVLNGWGLTETSPVLACRRQDRNVRGGVGLPTPGTQLRVVDPDTLAPLGPGARGLLLARGPGVMGGYWRDEAASARAFRAGDGWFDTGDLGWIVPGPPSSPLTGQVVLCGRAKDTVVLSSGKNVEPQPLEDAVAASPLIKFAVVMGQDKRELGCLVWPDEEALAAAPEAALGPQQLEDRLMEEVARLNSSRPDYHPYDHIAHIAVVRTPLSVDDGTLTRTMKPRRPEIMRRHAAAADGLMRRLRG